MPRGKQSKGQCVYCKIEGAKNGMAKHLTTCEKRQALMHEAEHSKRDRETLYHLRIQDAWRPDFWLDVEIGSSRTLKDLDFYLRSIWLECCGHLSQFSLGGGPAGEIALKRRVDEAFKRTDQLTHIYDFGTTSETVLKVVETREGRATTTHPIALLARNLPPEAKCKECSQPAAWLCMECIIEQEEWGTLCEQHAKKHPHDNYGEPIPLVNSPRLGMCGYEGPADPPY